MLEVIEDDIYFNKRLIAKFYNNINLSNRRDFEEFVNNLHMKYCHFHSGYCIKGYENVWGLR